MAQISNLVKHKINKQTLQPIIYNCADYHEFTTIKETLDPLFIQVVYKEIGYMGAYVAMFKTKGADSKQVEYELSKVKKEYDNRN